MALRCGFLHYSGSGIETTFTQGEDNFLAALAEGPPPGAGGRRALTDRRRGRWADVVEDQFRRILKALGISRVSFLPPRRSTELPAVAPQHTSHPGPALAGGGCETSRRPRRADTFRALPAWRGGHDHVAQRPLPMPSASIAGAFSMPSPSPVAGGRERRLRRGAPTSKEGVCSLFPDSQAEPSIARFLYREAGVIPVEIGSPYLHRHHMAPEFALLPDDVFVSEGQDVDNQLDRCRAARPDLAICGMGLANPLEAEGIATKWSIELVFTPIQGYEQAGDLAELFVRPLARRARLKQEA